MTELEYSDFLKEETDLEREANLILEHHGIKGQRWGVRRYQNADGSLTDAGSKRYAKKKSGGIIASIKKKRAAKARKAKRAKAKAEKKKTESNEEIRKKLLTSTDPEFLYKNRALLTSNELKERIDRITTEARMKDLIPDPNAKRKKAIKQGEESLKSLASMAESVGKIYKVYNQFSGDGKKDSGGGGQQNDKKKDEKKKDSELTKKEKKDKKKDAAANAKAAKELFSDPGMQALLALGMAQPVSNAKGVKGQKWGTRKKPLEDSNR